MKNRVVKTGLDGLLEDPSAFRRRRVGLLANAASVTSRFVPAFDALSEAGLDIRVLFGPEHGLTGVEQDMVPIEAGAHGPSKPSAEDGFADTAGTGPGRRAGTGPSAARPTQDARPPIVSLYGDSFESLSPEPSRLERLDLVIADLPDVGSRYYTFVWTTALMLKACAARGIPVVVLDRPNPLGGLILEGNLPDQPYLSFVGLYPVVVRHAMTPGEIARYVNAEFEIGADLSVIPLSGGGGEPVPRERVGEVHSWVLPSPNMPTVETARVYPGTCLFEGTNLSEGRGTTRPFEIVGAPWLDALSAARAANALALPGIAFRPHTFRPTFQKHAQEVCGGVQLHVTDVEAFRPYETGLRLLKCLRDLDPTRFRWRRKRYEFRDDVPAIDLLTGTRAFRELVDANQKIDPWVETFGSDIARFVPGRERALLYHTSIPYETGFPPTILIVGAQGSGKTTLIVRVIEALAAHGVKVSAVKHTIHAHDTDTPGKDSTRFADAGADPSILVAASRTAAHRRLAQPPSLLSLLRQDLAGAEAVLVEGYRDAPFPKIEVVRAATGRAPLLQDDPNVVAVVTDRETFHAPSVPRINFGDISSLLEVVRRVLGLRVSP